MSELSFTLYVPLLVLGALYVALRVVAAVGEGRGRGSSVKYLDLAFATLLIAAAYVVVLLILSVVTFPNRTGTMLSIFVIVGVFFGLLATVLLVITDYGLGSIGRARRRRRGVESFD